MVLAASLGMDEAADARLASESSDPANPFTTAARERAATFDREATTPTGETVHRRLPAAAHGERWRRGLPWGDRLRLAGHADADRRRARGP